MAEVDATVEVAFNAGYTTAAASRTWTDVTSYVEGPISIDRGRQNEQSDVTASTCSVTLDNTDGRFTPEYAAGAYYPNVKKSRPIRVRTSPLVLCFDSFGVADSAVAVWDGPSGPGRTTQTGGLTWTGQVQDWGVSSTKAYMSGTGGTVVVDVGQSDVTVECTYTTGATLTLSGLACRFVDDSNRIRVLSDTGGGGRWLLQKVIAGATTNVATGGVAAVSTSYALKVVLSGSSVEVFVNGVSTLSGTISDAAVLSATKFGLGAASSSTDYRWDDFQVTGKAAQFLGYVDEWPVSWPGGSDAMSLVTVSATSRQARLGRSLPLRSVVEEEYLDDAPVLYWPLGEPTGATEAGNIAAGRAERLVATQLGSGGTLTFGAGTGPGTDDLTAPVFTPVDASNGLWLKTTASQPLWTLGDKHVEVECFFSTTESGRSMPLVRLGDGLTGSADTILLYVDQATGKVIGAIGTGAGGGAVVSAQSASSVRDGNVHHAMLRVSMSGTNASITLITDGATATGGPTGWPLTSGGAAYIPNFTYIDVGGGHTASGYGLFSGGISHVAIHSQPTTNTADARFVAHRDAGSTGFSGEASGARIARYARYAGIPTAEISTETGLSTSIAHRDTTGQQAIAMMQDVARTEDGVVFDGKDGTLTFHARSHRYGAVSAFTLDCSAGDVQAGLSPVLDDQGVLNDVTASREGGTTARSVSQASIDEIGLYRDSLDLMTTSDAEVQNRADWEVNRRATPRVKMTSITADLRTTSDAQAALLLAADIGTRFTVSNLPSQAPAASMDFFIEGIPMEISDNSFLVTFNTSAAVLSAVWILDSATNSQLDSTTVLAY